MSTVNIKARWSLHQACTLRVPVADYLHLTQSIALFPVDPVSTLGTMKLNAALLGLLAVAVAAPAPAPQDKDKPSGHEVEIQAVTYGGTGCPDQTVQGLLSDDRTTITLSFDAYTVQSGPNIPATERRKFCQLQLKLKYPGGFQYSIFGADYRGYASLEEGVTGTAQSTYYFSGQQNQACHICGHPIFSRSTYQLTTF